MNVLRHVEICRYARRANEAALGQPALFPTEEGSVPNPGADGVSRLLADEPKQWIPKESSPSARQALSFAGKLEIPLQTTPE